MCFISFDTEKNAWTTIKSMNYSRNYPTSAVWNGSSIIVAGGCSNKNDLEPIESVESYDPFRKIWTQLAPMHHGRANFALAKWSRFLYAMGYDQTVERFDPNHSFWELVNLGVRIRERGGRYSEVFLAISGKCDFEFHKQSVVF